MDKDIHTFFSFLVGFVKVLIWAFFIYVGIVILMSLLV